MERQGQQINVGIVEDDVLTREKLKHCIDVSSHMSCAFAVATVREAIKAMDEHQPKVMLVDLCLPDGSGVQVLSHMRASCEESIALVVSALGDEASVVRAIKAGAMGYLLKDDTDAMVEASITQLLQGGSPISPSIARHLIKHFQPVQGKADPATHSADSLSSRELDVLTLAAKGYSYQEVAELLGVTPNTISSYTKKIYEKLAVHSRNEALFEATRLGLVQPPNRD